MSIIVPILSTFNAAGVNAASKKFGELDGISAKTGAAFQSAFLPAVAVVGALGLALEGSIKAAIDDYRKKHGQAVSGAPAAAPVPTPAYEKAVA